MRTRSPKPIRNNYLFYETFVIFNLGKNDVFVYLLISGDLGI